MRKGVVIGVVAGFVVLAVVFSAGMWLGGSQAPEQAAVPAVPATAPVAPAPRIAGQGPSAPDATGGQVSPQAGTGAAVPPSDISSQERRKRLNEVRRRMAALTAQGPDASPAEVNAALTELEALTQGELDPRYFQSLRTLLASSAKVQALNRELQTLSNSLEPKDVARRKVILEELPRVAATMSAEASNVQTYARRATAAPSTAPAPAGKAP